MAPLLAVQVFTPKTGQSRFFFNIMGQCRYRRWKKGSVGNKTSLLGQCRYFVGSVGIVPSQVGQCGTVGSTIYGADREPIWHNRYPRRQAMADGEERDDSLPRDVMLGDDTDSSDDEDESEDEPQGAGPATPAKRVLRQRAVDE